MAVFIRGKDTAHNHYICNRGNDNILLQVNGIWEYNH